MLVLETVKGFASSFVDACQDRRYTLSGGSICSASLRQLTTRP